MATAATAATAGMQVGWAGKPLDFPVKYAVGGEMWEGLGGRHLEPGIDLGLRRAGDDPLGNITDSIENLRQRLAFRGPALGAPSCSTRVGAKKCLSYVLIGGQAHVRLRNWQAYVQIEPRNRLDFAGGARP